MIELHATAQDYRKALPAVRDLRSTNSNTWTLWVNLLRLQYAAPEHTIGLLDLAEQAKLTSGNIAGLRYGALGEAIAKQLGYVAPNKTQGDKKPMWWTTLSTALHSDDKDPTFRLVMRPELVEAIELMGWVKPQPAPQG